jgi:hypothetical protein
MSDKYIIEHYLNGKSALKIADELGITVSAVYWALQKNNVKRRSNQVNSRKYEVNESFFEKIDTEEKAYWLGFIYADGYVTSTYVGITLSSEDKDHLEKYKKSISSTHPVNTYVGNNRYGDKITSVEYSRVMFSSRKMVGDLSKLGVIPKKTLVLKFPTPEQVPNELVRHFIRGYNDGDGSYAINGQGAYSIKICGTHDFLTNVASVLGVNPTLSKRHDDEKDNYYITIGGQKDVQRITQWMYEDATVYLERKYNRAKMYMCN